jgi:DNA-binding Lrp family transcriptional regulator
MDVYREILRSGVLSSKRLAVYEYLFNFGPLTGGQVQKALGNGVSESVRNRITELVKMGAVYEIGEVSCPVTGRRVLLFDVTSKMPVSYERVKSKKEIIRELEEEVRNLKKIIKGFAEEVKNDSSN